MKLTIIGASAGVGRSSAERALERGHLVTTLARSAVSIAKTPNLTALKGSATNPDDLKRALDGAEAVIVALGTGTSTKATTLYTDFAAALLKIEPELRPKIPFIILTGFGAGASGAYQGILMKIVFATLLKAVYRNKTALEETIAKSSINWEFVRPGLLKDRPLTEKYRVETDYYKGMKIGAIGRADVADFMVKQAEKPTLLGKYPALSNE